MCRLYKIKCELPILPQHAPIPSALAQRRVGMDVTSNLRWGQFHPTRQSQFGQ
jgi:hypothetical protein